LKKQLSWQGIIIIARAFQDASGTLYAWLIGVSMNKANHKALGRYCYGGKIYTGLCPKCGTEHLVTIDQVQEIINNSYLQPQSKLQQKFKGRVAVLEKAFSLFL